MDTLRALQMPLLLPTILNLSRIDISVSIKLYVRMAPLDFSMLHPPSLAKHPDEGGGDHLGKPAPGTALGALAKRLLDFSKP